MVVCNDATSDYVPVAGESVYREYYTSPAEGAAGEDDTICLLRSFEDVSEKAWYSEAVNRVCTNGLMISTSNIEFKPEAKPACVQVAAVIMISALPAQKI